MAGYLQILLLAACAVPLYGCSIVRPPHAEAVEPASISTPVGPVAQMSESNEVPWPRPVEDDHHFTFVRLEQLEYRLRSHDPDALRFEAQGWHGGDYHKLWVKTEGEQSVEGPSEGELEIQSLYSRMIAPFWDFQVGVRYDTQWASGPDKDRWFGVIGLQGVSPYEFELEPALFVSEDGDVSARLTATTDILFTQRLILQPRVETEIAFQDVSEFQIGQGFNYVNLGLRLRYEIIREVAPYVGVNWVRQLGETANRVRRNEGAVEDFSVVCGFSLWF